MGSLVTSPEASTHPGPSARVGAAGPARRGAKWGQSGMAGLERGTEGPPTLYRQSRAKAAHKGGSKADQGHRGSGTERRVVGMG